VLLSQEDPSITQINDHVAIYTYGTQTNQVAFIANDHVSEAGVVNWNGTAYTIKPRSVLIFKNGKLLHDTAQVQKQDVVSHRWESTGTPLAKPELLREPVPSGKGKAHPEGVFIDTPQEQLAFTKDRSDYVWYTTTIDVATSKTVQLYLEGVGDFAYVFLDGHCVGKTSGPLPENRFLWPDKTDLALMKDYAVAFPAGFAQRFSFFADQGKHELSLLVVSQGIIKIDFMLGGVNMVNERKGLWGAATLDGVPLRGFTILPGLIGEREKVFDSKTVNHDWKPAERNNGKIQGPIWIRYEWHCDNPRLPYAIDLAGFTKGTLYVNGQCLARYWLINGNGVDPVTHAWGIPDSTLAEPTQRYYRMPSSFLLQRNTIVMFEEDCADIKAVQVCLRQRCELECQK
jgi:beta-galactosidase